MRPRLRFQARLMLDLPHAITCMYQCNFTCNSKLVSPMSLERERFKNSLSSICLLLFWTPLGLLVCGTLWHSVNADAAIKGLIESDIPPAGLAEAAFL